MTPTLCEKKDCTGCGACVNTCPQQCITMIVNMEGFLEPNVDHSQCVSCGLCEKACPILSPPAASQGTPKVYACWSLNQEVRCESSSGGMFSILASRTLADGGVIFGAAWDDTVTLHHTFAETPEQLFKLRKSKYVQSTIGDSYLNVKSFIDQNRPVLFIGTPCQVAGLYAFLGERHNELLTTCDMLCHGVPSPAVFKAYIHSLDQTNNRVVNIVHRTKSGICHGNVTYFTEIAWANGKKRISDDLFIHGFLTSLYLRTSCHQCRFVGTKRYGDFTIGDFWGLGQRIPFTHPVKKGVSLVLLNTEKANKIFFTLKEDIFYREERTLQEAVMCNETFITPSKAHSQREQFFQDFRRLPFREVSQKYLRKSLKERLGVFLKLRLGPDRVERVLHMLRRFLR